MSVFARSLRQQPSVDRLARIFPRNIFRILADLFMFCLHCGEEIPDQSTFCMACGKPIAPVRKGSLPWLPIAAVVGAFLLGVLLMTMRNFADRRSTSPPSASVDTTQSAAAPVSKSDRPSSLPKTLEPVSEPKLTPAEISSKFSGSVVTIYKRGENGLRAGQGSGFLLGRDLAGC